MEKAIRERYNDEILQEAMRRYGIGGDDIKLLDGFESYMFEFRQDGAEFILRIGHSIRRSVALIRGEVDWLNYLYDGGVGVARAIPSRSGELVEVIEDGRGGQFLAVAFIKAKGGSPSEEGRWNEVLFERYGRVIGRMHALSKDYQPADPAWRRRAWDDPLNIEIFHWLPADQTAVVSKGSAIVEYLRSLPQDEHSYGLIHQDAHGGNFFVDDQGNITLFDFDDCIYSWYVNDIAMVVFYAVTNHEDPEGFAVRFWPHFWRGYCQENDLDPVWLAEMPAFFKLREIDLYAIIHRSFDVDNLTDRWVAQFMDGRRRRIEGDVPYLNIDFTKLA
jgi:Ser/Thr protein kinase RdoA (MazF antagonist)